MWKRFDLLADEKLGVLHIINTRFPDWRHEIDILEPPLQINELHVIFSKKISDHQKITNNFNQGLEEIIADGAFDALFKEYGFSQNN
ncbi:hypothetical protein [Psychromonas aquimarina]|uniref:hypothetical protein n=1 Tax=Psychromonas aquimarina TaxID=444919 RepID=UPI00041AE44B|nr:hypothetical protein [Psychromonas aquimarina]